MERNPNQPLAQDSYGKTERKKERKKKKTKGVGEWVGGLVSHCGWPCQILQLKKK